jgi:hypothetical protein
MDCFGEGKGMPASASFVDSQECRAPAGAPYTRAQLLGTLKKHADGFRDGDYLRLKILRICGSLSRRSSRRWIFDGRAKHLQKNRIT